MPEAYWQATGCHTQVRPNQRMPPTWCASSARVLTELATAARWCSGWALLRQGPTTGGRWPAGWGEGVGGGAVGAGGTVSTSLMMAAAEWEGPSGMRPNDDDVSMKVGQLGAAPGHPQRSAGSAGGRGGGDRAGSRSSTAPGGMPGARSNSCNPLE